MKFYKGMVLPKRRVLCSGGCGRTLLRAQRFDDAKCAACAQLAHQQSERNRMNRLHEQARRYRVLMALSPYKSFEELLAAIRIRQPRALRRDLAGRRSAA